MTTDANQITHESLTSKSFRAPSTTDERHRVEISGFGVRVPGGAQKPRSRESAPGLLHVRRALFTHSFAGRPLRTDSLRATAALTRERATHTFSPHPIQTVRHITSLRTAMHKINHLLNLWEQRFERLGSAHRRPTRPYPDGPRRDGAGACGRSRRVGRPADRGHRRRRRYGAGLDTHTQRHPRSRIGGYGRRLASAPLLTAGINAGEVRAAVMPSDSGRP